jgi:hypothetical protein
MREEETEIPAFAGMTACLGIRLAPDYSTRRSVFQPNRETLKTPYPPMDHVTAKFASLPCAGSGAR